MRSALRLLFGPLCVEENGYSKIIRILYVPYCAFPEHFFHVPKFTNSNNKGASVNSTNSSVTSQSCPDMCWKLLGFTQHKSSIVTITLCTNLLSATCTWRWYLLTHDEETPSPYRSPTLQRPRKPNLIRMRLWEWHMPECLSRFPCSTTGYAYATSHHRPRARDTSTWLTQ